MTGPISGEDRPSPDGPPGTRGPQRPPPQHAVKRTRIGGVWFAAAPFAVLPCS
jgi:hypothetical protein